MDLIGSDIVLTLAGFFVMTPQRFSYCRENFYFNFNTVISSVSYWEEPNMYITFILNEMLLLLKFSKLKDKEIEVQNRLIKKRNLRKKEQC